MIFSRHPYVLTRTIPSTESALLQDFSGFAEEDLSVAYRPVPSRLQYIRGPQHPIGDEAADVGQRVR
jgi:hypothetical protein